jgi:predicted RNA-binding protein with TRAM domain
MMQGFVIFTKTRQVKHDINIGITQIRSTLLQEETA